MILLSVTSESARNHGESTEQHTSSVREVVNSVSKVLCVCITSVWPRTCVENDRAIAPGVCR